MQWEGAIKRELEGQRKKILFGRCANSPGKEPGLAAAPVQPALFLPHFYHSNAWQPQEPGQKPAIVTG